MRHGALGQRLGRMGALQAVWTLELIIRGALQRSAHHLAVYECMWKVHCLASHLGSRFLNEMLVAGTEEGCIAAVQWLRSEGLDEEPKFLDADRLVARSLREMTLGERRALARRAPTTTIDLLLGDPDPGVIQNLLNNPRLTEAMVLRICSRRPTVSVALETVFEAQHWAGRYRVRAALVRNPHLALKYSLNLLVFLRIGDLADIKNDATLSSMLRLGAQRLLDLMPEKQASGVKAKERAQVHA